MQLGRNRFPRLRWIDARRSPGCKDADAQSTPKPPAPAPRLARPCTQNLSGRRLDNAPRWSTSIFANYERPVGTVPRIDLPVLGYFHADWSYQSEIFLQQDLDPNLVQPGYGQLNLRTGLKSEDGHWELAFGVRNATNTAFNVVGFDVPIVNGFAVINGAPRTFYGSIRYRY